MSRPTPTFQNGGLERLASIGALAASIGHELRNPLAVIESSMFVLRRHLGAEATTRPEIAKHLDRIDGEVERAKKTIRDLLDLARNRPPVRTPTALRPLVESAAAACQLPAEVGLNPAGVAPHLEIEVDADQFRQVLINLFTNAAQAMGGRGTIHVMADAPSPDVIHVRVRDEGPGVAPGARLFEALFTTKAQGTGLGLAICRRILEAHGGSIQLESPTSPAGGATFLLTVPRPAAASAI